MWGHCWYKFLTMWGCFWYNFLTEFNDSFTSIFHSLSVLFSTIYLWVVVQVLMEFLPYLTVRLAKLAVDKVLTAPCDTSILFPNTGGNLHCFTAITPCAVLDILAPPYSENAGRKCTYYHDYPYTSFCKPFVLPFLVSIFSPWQTFCFVILHDTWPYRVKII